MNGFSQEQWRLVLRGMFVAGTLVILLAVVFQRAHYISYQMLGIALGAVVLIFGALLTVYVASRGRVDSQDVVQFSRMDTEHGHSETEHSSQENGHILSPEEARQWLDDFLVSQQKVNK